MSTMVAELYDALRKAGVDEQTAKDAARAVLVEMRSDLATKGDVLALKTDLAELKAELFKHTTQTLLWMTTINAALMTTILALFRFLP